MSVQRISRTSRVPRPGIDWFNKVGQAVNDHEQRSKTFGRRAASPISKEPQALIVLVKNTTEDTIGQYRPLDLDGTVIHEQNIVLKGVVGAGGRCVITQEVIPAGKVGRAAISGVTFAWVEGYTAAQAGSSDGVMQFASGRAQVIYDTDSGSTGERIAVVLLDEATHAFAVGTVTASPTSGTKTGFALVQIAHCSDSQYVGQSVWVADWLGQLLADEAAADRVDRKVAIFLASSPLSIHTVTDSATSTTVGTPWVLIHANCPEVV